MMAVDGFRAADANWRLTLSATSLSGATRKG
jgi:hypothetical protein